MGVCHNLVLVLITGLVIYISYLFTPVSRSEPIDYTPKCLKLDDLSHFLCAFSKKISNQLNQAKFSSTSLKDDMRSLTIINQQGIKAFGIKSPFTLSTAEFLHFIDYQIMKQPKENKDITLEKLQPIIEVINDLQMEALVTRKLQLTNQKNSDSGVNLLPHQIIIKPEQFSSFVVYEITKSPIMKSKIFYLNEDLVNSRFSLIASLAGFVTLLVILIYEICVKKDVKYTLVINLSILIMVFLISRQQKYHIGLHDYDIPAALFFVLCLSKSQAPKWQLAIILTFLLLTSAFEATILTIVGFFLTILLFLFHGIRTLGCGNVFHYLWICMLVFTIVFSERMYMFNFDRDILRKITLAGILTLSTVLMQTMEETIMQQFEEMSNQTTKVSHKMKGFAEVQNEDLDN